MIPHLVHIFTTGLQTFMRADICHLSTAAVDIIYMHLRSLLVICFGPFLALTSWTENSFFTLSVCVCVCVCVREKDFCYMACNCRRQKSPVCLYVLAFDGRSVRPPKKSQHLLHSLLASENLQLHLTSCGLLLGYSSQSLSFGTTATWFYPLPISGNSASCLSFISSYCEGERFECWINSEIISLSTNGDFKG